MKNILILGDGGREKIIKEKLYRDNKYIHCICSSFKNFENIKQFCITENIELVIPSSEVYLCNGIVDYLRKEINNIQVFGPTKEQAKIEGSKYFSKNLMKELDIPTAKFFGYFTLPYCIDSLNYFSLHGRAYDEIVIKYSGLAKGKGVYLPRTKAECENIVKTLFNKDESACIIIEERLHGVEVSVLAFCNGKETFLMPQAQDYKRIYDGDKGPNTGGMGAICPANVLTNDELIKVKTYMDKIVKRLNYKGVLYAGLMKTKDDVYFLEFNCRFGDPEAQVILSLLDSNLLNIMKDCINENTLTINWKNNFAATVVLSHILYPVDKLENNVNITYSNDIDNSIEIYESNVTTIDKYKYTTGGRVLSVVSVDKTLQIALENIYNNIHKIKYDGVFYRRDIGCNNPILMTSDIPIGILASGNGTCLQRIFEEKLNCIKIIITDNNNVGIIKKALKYNIPFMYAPKTDNKTEYYENIVNIFRSFDIKIVLLAGYMSIVPDILFEEFDTINIHPSLLPNYSGLMNLNVHKKVIENKDIFSGCTLHKVTRDVDKGRILLQKQYKLTENETPETLKKEIQLLEKDCIFEYINNYTITKTEYAVDIKEGNKFIVELKKTNPIIGGFCSKYNHKGIILAAAADGCGTKIELSNKYNKLDTIGIDLVAMNVNDLLAGGAKPLFFMDYIAIDKMNKKKCIEIIKGINKGCGLASCELIGGETAEMKGIYLKDRLDIAGFSVGEVVFDLPKTNLMNDKCILYGIPSSGIHSNGYTLVRELLKRDGYKPSMDEILKPTRIYTELLELYEKYPQKILGVAHITGGGFHDNLIRILPENLYFELDNWEFPDIFKWIQKESQLIRDDMLSTFNCGYGMVIISSASLPLQKIGKLIKQVKKDEKIILTWADSLSKNIFESVTLEIGNPIDDGYNYIKQVITNDELKK